MDPPPLAITVTAQPSTAKPGDTIVFRFSATGPSLSSVRIEFGDSESEEIGTSGASRATGTMRHAYRTAGTYSVVATAVSGQDLFATGRTTVQITAASPALAARPGHDRAGSGPRRGVRRQKGLTFAARIAHIPPAGP